MVDAHVWGACGEICTGSSPVFDTIKKVGWGFYPNDNKFVGLKAQPTRLMTVCSI